MCYASGSIDQAVNPCPMCKVFPHSRCPHIRETCRNRALHPRMDVLYLKNAEVDRFNGCGYCKWAQQSPPPVPKQSGYNNLGWPGCCRPPLPSEYRLISAAEWRSVSIIHHISIPTEMKAVLDGLSLRNSSSSGPPPAFPNTTPGRITGSGRPANDRKNSGGSSPSSKPSSLSKSLVNTPNRGRPGGSPQPPSAHLSRSSSGNGISSSVPTVSTMDHYMSERRQRGTDILDKRIEGVHSSHSSPSRKNVDLDHPATPRRVSSIRRPAVTPATTSVSVSKVVADSPTSGQQNSIRRRSSVSKPESPSTSTSTTAARNTERPLSFVVPRSAKKVEDGSSTSSSSGSSDGLGSLSDSTVTSDGGFTDYLSDESEAELQRQAEAKAALLAQNQAEELEFKAARLQLAHVDLRPPKSWNPTNLTNSSVPRVSGDSNCPPQAIPIVGTTFSPGAMARIGQTRG